MGKMEMLKSGYTGKVGTIYGSKGRGKINAKIVPFSHSPHNENQKSAFNAFGCLQRTSSLIAKNLWQYLGLSDKKMLRTNAVSQWLKPLVSSHQYSLSKITDFIPDDNSQRITLARYSKSANEIRIDFERTVERPQGVGSKTLIVVADDIGRAYVADATENLVFSKVYAVGIEDVRPLTVAIFERHTFKNKTLFSGGAVAAVQEVE